MSSLIYLDWGRTIDKHFIYCDYDHPGLIEPIYYFKQPTSMTENGESIEEFVANMKRQAGMSAQEEMDLRHDIDGCSNTKINAKELLKCKPDPHAFGPRRSPFLPSLAKGGKKFSDLFKPNIDRKDRK